MAPGRGPAAITLDAAIADRPALLTSEDGHSLWANSLALRRAGVDGDTPDPANGVIERDRLTGVPSAPCARAPSTCCARRPNPTPASSASRACGAFSARSPARWASRRCSTRCSSPASRSLTPLKLCSGTVSSPCVTGRASGCAPTFRPASSSGPRAPSASATTARCSRPTPSSCSPTGSSRATPPSSTNLTPTPPATAAFPEWPAAALKAASVAAAARGFRAPLPCHRRRRHGDGARRHRRRPRRRSPRRPAGDHPRPAHAPRRRRAVRRARRDRRPQPLLVPQGRLLLRPSGALPGPRARRARVSDGELLRRRSARRVGQRLSR